MKIHHVGIAVPSIDRFLREQAAVLEPLQRGETIENARQGVRELFVTDGRTVLELLEPSGERSPLAGVLKQSPRGRLVHVALEVSDLDATIARVEAAGGRVITGPIPDVAFAERRIAFVWLGGHVTELIECDPARP